MTKFATPSTVIPGAQKAMSNGIVPVQLTDEKRRPIWRKPNPVYYVEHKTNGRVTKVPIYRGCDASRARYHYAQERRTARKALEKKNVV